MKSYLKAGCTVALIVGLLAPPAAAVPSAGIINFGQAEVGQTMDCAKSGGEDPEGPGLQFPQAKDAENAVEGAPKEKERVYRFEASVLDVPRGAGVLDICGRIGAVAGIGPRCDMSKGYNGKGFITFPDTGSRVKLDDVTWKASAAGTLPVIGKAWEMAGGSKTKPMELVALVQAQGGLSCADGWDPSNTDDTKTGGSTAFAVVGTYTLLQPVQIDDDPIKSPGESSITNPLGKPNDKQPKTAP